MKAICPTPYGSSRSQSSHAGSYPLHNLCRGASRCFPESGHSEVLLLRRFHARSPIQQPRPGLRPWLLLRRICEASCRCHGGNVCSPWSPLLCIRARANARTTSTRTPSPIGPRRAPWLPGAHRLTMVFKSKKLRLLCMPPSMRRACKDALNGNR